MGIKIFTFFLLFLFWVGINGWPEEKNVILFAALPPFITFWVIYYLRILPKNFNFNINSLKYFAWLLKEIIKSALNVMKIIWSKNLNISSNFEWIDTRQKNNTGLVIFANSITLTPGTVTLDIKDNMLLIHALEQSSINDLKKGEMDYKVNKIIINN